MANQYGPSPIYGSSFNIYRQYMGLTQDPNPEDIEEIDRENIRRLIDKYLDDTYPKFDPQIVTRIDSGEVKEYYLPALKVLKLVDKKFYSPSRESEWVDGELKAVCRENPYFLPAPKPIMDSHGDIVGMKFDEDVPHGVHVAPDESCDCGIYGSVNLEEVYEYMHLDSPTLIERDQPKNVLCVIEPTPDAKVIICRKGWKASHAFISEIVGETISPDYTSQLLSIAWCRNIDIRRIYENR